MFQTISSLKRIVKFETMLEIFLFVCLFAFYFLGVVSNMVVNGELYDMQYIYILKTTGRRAKRAKIWASGVCG